MARYIGLGLLLEFGYLVDQEVPHSLHGFLDSLRYCLFNGSLWRTEPVVGHSLPLPAPFTAFWRLAATLGVCTGRHHLTAFLFIDTTRLWGSTA